MYAYKTNFYLSNEVLDICGANDFFEEENENMTKCLKSDFSKISDKIIKIEWKLTKADQGIVVLNTEEKLSKETLNEISGWIQGQNSDGIGENFEQEYFASYTEREWDQSRGYNLSYEDDENNGDCLTVCEFDWRTNQYELELQE